MAQVTEKKLRSWLEECVRCQATHMLLVVDRTEDFELSPVKVLPHQNVHDIISYYNTEGNEVTEVYSMKHSIDEQLESDVPVFNGI